jgi:hypothetical protein
MNRFFQFLWILVVSYLSIGTITNSIESRPGGGGSYRSSSSSSSSSRSSSSSSSYRSSSSSSSYKSSSNSSSTYSNTTSKSSNSTPNYKDTELDILILKNNFNIRKNASISIEQYFKLNYSKKGDRIQYFFYSYPFLNETKDLCKPTLLNPKIPIAKLSNTKSKISSASFYRDMKYSSESTICRNNLYLVGDFEGNDDLTINYELFRNFYIDTNQENIHFFLPLNSSVDESKNLKSLDFQLSLPEDFELDSNQLKVVYWNDYQKKYPNQAILSKKGNETYGNISLLENDKSPLFLELTLPAKVFNFQNLSTYFFYNYDTHKKIKFESVSIQLEFLEDSTLKVREQFKASNENTDLNFEFNKEIPISFFHYRKDFRKKDTIYYIEKNIFPVSNYSYLSNYENAYVFNGKASEGNLDFTYISYGQYFEEGESGSLIYWLNPNEKYDVEKIELEVKYPSNLQLSIDNFKFRNNEMNLPYQVTHEGNQIKIVSYGLLNYDILNFEIVNIPKKLIKSPPFFLQASLWISYFYDSSPYMFYFGVSSLFLSLCVGLVFVYRAKQKEIRQLIIEKEISNAIAEFDKKLFLSKVELTASLLNDAWTKNQMKKVRSVVSGGIFNRFSIQLEIMQKQGIVNYIDHWKIKSLQIIDSSTSERLASIHVELKASSRDTNLNINLTEDEKLKQLKVTPTQEYTEIWSFIKAKDTKSVTGMGILEGNCPNCGADVKKLTDQNKCNACGVLFNSGEYDWVLSEITQEVEWSNSSSSELNGWTSIQKEFPFLSRQVIEDRASVLFWKWIQCKIYGDSKYIQREITSERKLILQEGGEYLSDVAVGSVDLMECIHENEILKAKVLINWSACFLKGGVPVHKKSHLWIHAKRENLFKFGVAERGCESCGAPMPEVGVLNCEYCGNEVPGKLNDWYFYDLNIFD